MLIKDKIIVVTGGAGLIGQTFCKAISKNGGIAIIADMDDEKAREVSTNIENSFPLSIDINSKESCNIGLQNIVKKYGKIDALVNNAYPRIQNYGNDFFDVDYKDFCEMLNKNLGGYFLTSQIYAKYFIDQGHGNIINISSIYGVVAPKFDVYNGVKMTMPVEYAAIKSGLIHLTKYLATYLKGLNIRVNAISPGGILDGQPQEFIKAYGNHCLNKGMLETTDLSGTLIYLLSEMSKCVNGQNIIVDDGFTL